MTSLAVHDWQLAPPTASSSVLLTTSQRQTMSTRSSSVKRCLPNASSSVDHVPKSTRLFSAGSKVIRGIFARRRESLGTRLLMIQERLAKLRDIVHENLENARATQKEWYDRHARDREFQPGDQVLVLPPPAPVNY